MDAIRRRLMMQKQGFPAGYTAVSGIYINSGAYCIVNTSTSSTRAGLKYIFTKYFSETSYRISGGGIYRAVNAPANVLGFNTGTTASGKYMLDETIETHEITIDYLQDGKVKYDGLEDSSSSGRNSRIGIGAYLNSQGTPTGNASNIVIHLVETTYKNTINHTYVPAVRDSDGVAGFIDIAKGKEYGSFYPSQTSVPFVVVY